MSQIQRKANLTRLCAELDAYSATQVPPPPTQPSPLAGKLSNSLFLSNSSTPETFAHICQSRTLFSRERLASQGIPVKPGKAEAAMGTANCVFFYLAPFRYPRTACGLLFAGSLESECSPEGAATPFDSGALHRRLARPDSQELAPAFLARHNLPIPDHRVYLERSLRLLFRSPEDYLNGVDPLSAGPLGLSGGDSRRWTHEVRIPDHVSVSTHLQAVFAPHSIIAAYRDIQSLFEWCRREGVDAEPFHAEPGSEFVGLESRSIDYLRKRIY
jgi:hypothetical protein